VCACQKLTHRGLSPQQSTHRELSPALHCTALQGHARASTAGAGQPAERRVAYREALNGSVHTIAMPKHAAGAGPRTFMVSSGSTARRPPEPTRVTPSVSCDRAIDASMRSALSRPSVLPAAHDSQLRCLGLRDACRRSACSLGPDGRGAAAGVFAGWPACGSPSGCAVTLGRATG
jgi:hypothetical protein